VGADDPPPQPLEHLVTRASDLAFTFEPIPAAFEEIDDVDFQSWIAA
jgi:hypothetical protein